MEESPSNLPEFLNSLEDFVTTVRHCSLMKTLRHQHFMPCYQILDDGKCDNAMMPSAMCRYLMSLQSTFWRSAVLTARTSECKCTDVPVVPFFCVVHATESICTAHSVELCPVTGADCG